MDYADDIAVLADNPQVVQAVFFERVYNVAVRSVLFYGCETWPVRGENLCRLTLLDYQCSSHSYEYCGNNTSAMMNNEEEYSN